MRATMFAIIRTLCFSSLALFLLALAALAQDETPKEVNNQNRSGDLPFSSSVGTEVESVDISTGHLSVRMPFVSLPGRGMNYRFGIRYDSGYWAAALRGVPGTYQYLWKIEKRTYVPDNGLGWQTTQPRLTHTQYREICGGITHYVGHKDSYIWHDADGGAHPLDLEVQQGGCQWPVGSGIDQGGYSAQTPNAPDTSGTGMWASDWFTRGNKLRLADGTLLVGTGPTLVDDLGSFSYNYEDLYGGYVDPEGNQKSEYPGGFDTLGRAIVTQQNGTNQVLFKAYDSNGTLQTYTVNYAPITLSTHFNVTSGSYGPIAENSETRNVITSVVLPNGRSYQFQYETNGFGGISRIDLPTGAYVTYVWDTWSDHERSYRYITSRTLNVDGQTYTWNFARGALIPGNGESFPVTVTDPLLNQTVYMTDHGSVSSAKLYTGWATGEPLRQYDVNYLVLWGYRSTDETGRLPTRLTTTLDNGQVSKKEFDYDTVSYNYQTCWDALTCAMNATPDSGTASTSRGNVTEIREYDYGQGVPGALLRRTHNDYGLNSDTNYVSRNIVGKITQTTVYDSMGNTCKGLSQPCAQTQYEYDNYVAGDNPLQTTANAAQHDYTNYSSTFIYRGNVTRAKRWRNNDGALLMSTYSYDDLGNIRAIKDPLNLTTTYDYTDKFANSFCLPPSGQNGQAYVSTVTNALGQQIKVVRFPCTGLVQARKDQNDINAARDGTTFTYDLLGRLTQKNLADGGQVATTYSDVPPVSAASTTKITSALNLAATTIADGLGRATQTRLTSDPQGTVFTDTTYDALGRVATVSNPYRTPTDPGPTNGISTSQYDALNRVTKLIPADGTTSSNNVSTLYAGNCATATDQAGKSRKSCSDALGRLVEVDEPGGVGPATPGTGSATVNGTEQSISGTSATPGSGSVTVSGDEQPYVCDPLGPPLPFCQKLYDAGTITIIVNGFTAQATYGRYSTLTSVVSALNTALNGTGSPVNSNISGSTLNLTAKTTGAATNYSLSASFRNNDPSNFPDVSFTASASGSTLTGGRDATPTTYDSGTAWVTVNGTQYSVNYGQSSTSATVASALASAMTAGSLVNATANGSVISITAKTTGAATNYTLSFGSSTSLPGTFASPSFTVSVSGAALTGGADPSGPSLATPAVTLYAYDTLDNLTRVDQKGNDPNPANWRTRTFTYDSLSRLLSASNPESGTITDTYDPDGNLLTKTAPAPNQSGTATATTTYAYDALHRLTQKSFSDTTPTVKYGYDGIAPPGCTPPTLTVTNGIGRHTSMCDAAGAEAWSYDAMGRSLTDVRTTGGITKTTSYAYNLDGSLASLTYPSGRTITYTPNAAGRTVSAVDSLSAINYATAATYAPHGALSSLTLGQTGTFTGINLNQGFNARLQPATIRAWSTNGVALDLSYGFNFGTANNGNVASITNNLVADRTQTFTYDELNRIKLARTQATTGTKCWGEAFSYDPWGNLLAIGGAAGYTGCTQENLSVAATTKNQVSGYTYDAAGNMTSVPSIASYTYNAENQLTQTAGMTYTYDGDGRRAQKSNGKLYWYGVGSDPLTETDAAGNNPDEFIFFGEKRIARRKSTGEINYYFADHLGTSRVVTSSTGMVLDDSDFYPFGGERTVVSSSGNSYKFTGKERDSESGLDDFDARYYSFSMGRFMSPDWSDSPDPVPYADLTNPQTLNLYGYVKNNPLRNADPTGHSGDDDIIDHVLNFAVSAVATFVSDNFFGAFRPTPKSPEGTFGQAVGDFAAQQSGIAEAEAGVAGRADAMLLAVAGQEEVAPAVAVASQAMILHGAATAAIATTNLAKSAAEQTSSGGPKPKDAPGVSAGGQATNEHGEKLGPSGKPAVHQVDHPTVKGAKDAARAEGKRAPVKHPSPKKGEPHFHATDSKGNKKPASTHHNYPN